MSVTRSASFDGSSSQSRTPSSATNNTHTLHPAASSSSLVSDAQGEIGSMRLEEKIARAYHRDLSWRKVLVRLEPDAHNNMIVRRQFANAYGWPVVKHLCDTHFADTWTARMRDEDEAAFDRAQNVEVAGKDGERQGEEAVKRDEGEEVKAQTNLEMPNRSWSEMREAKDELGGLKEVGRGLDRHRVSRDSTTAAGSISSIGSAVWDEVYFEGDSGDDDDVANSDDNTYGARFQKMVGGWGMGGGRASGSGASPSPTPSMQVQQKKKTPAEKRLENIRTGSGSSSHARPILSSENASGFFSPSGGSEHRLSPQVSGSSKKKDEVGQIQTQPQPTFVAEPETMDESESVDHGNLTPAISGPGFVKDGQGSMSGIAPGEEGLERMDTAPEVEWKDHHHQRNISEEGKGFGEAEVGLRKSVETQIASPLFEGGSADHAGKGEMVARLSSSRGQES